MNVAPKYWPQGLVLFNNSLFSSCSPSIVDAVTSAIRFKTISVEAPLFTRKIINMSNSIPPSLPSIRPEGRTHNATSRSLRRSFLCHQRVTVPSFRNNNLFVVRCSTKPGIDSNSQTNKNPPTGLDSTSTAQQLATTLPHRALTSTGSRGLVIDLGSKASWDSTEIGAPVVKRYVGDNEERWYMWYYGRSDGVNSDSIGLAISNNGIHWQRGEEQPRTCEDTGLVMNCSSNWWAFDTESIRPSDVVIMSSPMYSGVYWLYYTGYSSEEVDFLKVSNVSLENPERVYHENKKDGIHDVHGKVSKSLPGLACSQDGRHWARIEGDHHSGALLDVGSGKEWDSLFISSPQVVVHSSDDLRMYYYSFDVEKSQFALGIARSRDGIRWVKLGKIMGGGSKGSFDELGVKNSCVVKNRKGGNYLMAYEGVAADGKRSIGLAVSHDGLKNWKRLQEDPVLSPSEDGWDSEGVGSPYLVPMDGNVHEWRLYYVGISHGGNTAIGMAYSEGSDLRTFRKWEGF